MDIILQRVQDKIKAYCKLKIKVNYYYDKKVEVEVFTFENDGNYTDINFESTLFALKQIITLKLAEAPAKAPQHIDTCLLYIENMKHQPLQSHYYDFSNILTDITKKNNTLEELELVNLNDTLLKVFFTADGNECECNVYHMNYFYDNFIDEEKEVLTINVKTFFLEFNGQSDESIQNMIKNKNYNCKKDGDQTPLNSLNRSKELFNAIARTLCKYLETHTNLNLALNLVFETTTIEHHFEYTSAYVTSFNLDVLFKYFQTTLNVPLVKMFHENSLKLKMYNAFYKGDTIPYLQEWQHGGSNKCKKCLVWYGLYQPAAAAAPPIVYMFRLYSNGSYVIEIKKQHLNVTHFNAFLTCVQENITSRLRLLLKEHMNITVNDFNLSMDTVNFSPLKSNVQFTIERTAEATAATAEATSGPLEANVNADEALAYAEDLAAAMVEQFLLTDFQNLLKIINAQTLLFYNHKQTVPTFEFKGVNNYIPDNQIYNLIREYMVDEGVTDFHSITEEDKIPYLNNLITYIKGNFPQHTPQQIKRSIASWCENNKKKRFSFSFKKNEGNEGVGLVFSVQTKKNKDLLCTISKLSNFENLYTLLYYLTVLSYNNLAGGDDERLKELEELQITTVIFKDYISRLQTYLPTKYNPNVKVDNETYARKSQTSNGEQPIILPENTLEKIKKYYHDNNKLEKLANIYGGIEFDKEKKDTDVWLQVKTDFNISDKNYTEMWDTMLKELEVLEEAVCIEDEDDATFSYICPAAWCNVCELPFLISDLLLIEVVESKTNTKIKKLQCPNCSKTDILIRNLKTHQNSSYPGLLGTSVETHKWVKCFTSKDPAKEKKTSAEHILTSSPAGPTKYQRLMYLPDRLANLINGITTKKKNIYCRYGIVPPGEQHKSYLSFEHSLEFLLGNQIDQGLRGLRGLRGLGREGQEDQSFREKLIALLQQHPNIENIFQLCRRGSLYLYFDKQIELLYRYIEGALSLHPSIILALLGFPTVLAQNGINFVIFTQAGKAFECEFVNYPQGKNILMYKFFQENKTTKDLTKETATATATTATTKKTKKSKETKETEATATATIAADDTSSFTPVYEPITNSKKPPTEPYANDGVIHRQIEQIVNLKFNSTDSTDTQCAEKMDPRLKGDAPPRVQKIDLVALNNGAMVVLGQYVNTYNQTEGLVMFFSNKYFYFPIQPVPIIERLPIWTQQSQLPRQNLPDTLAFLHAMNIPNEKITLDAEYQRLFLVDTELFVPLLQTTKFEEESQKIIPLLKSANVLGANTTVSLNAANERLQYKHKEENKEFGYKKFMYEISKAVIQTNDDSMDTGLDTNTNTATLKETELKEFIKAFEKAKDMSEKNKIQAKVIAYLHEKFNHLFVQGTLGEWVEQDLLQQCSAAATEKCNTQSMCGEDNQTCKMIVPEENYTYFVQKLATQLLMNKTLQSDFFSGFQTFALLKPTDETIFYSMHEFAQYLKTEDYYDNRKFIPAPSLQHFDYTSAF